MPEEVAEVEPEICGKFFEAKMKHLQPRFDRHAVTVEPFLFALGLASQLNVADRCQLSERTRVVSIRAVHDLAMHPYKWEVTLTKE